MKKIAIIALLSAFASTAFAGDFYVVGSIGQSDANISKSQLDNDLVNAGATNLSSNLDNKGTAYKLLAGYQYNQYFGIEGGYIDLGKAKYSATATEGTARADVKATGWAISAVGTLPINDSFSVFAKLGTIRAKVEATASVSVPALGTFEGSADATNWKTTYGVGATYNFNKQIGLRAEYERFQKLGDDNNTGKSNVDLISAGLVFKF